MLRYSPSVPTFWRVFSTNGSKFCQKLFLHLLRWSISWCDVSHWLTCRYWNILYPWDKSHLIMVKWSEMKWSQVTQSCPTLCHPMDCNLPGSSVYEIFQAKILEWWYMICFMYCCIWFATTFLRIFAFIFISDIGLQFSFLWYLCLVLASGWWWLHRMSMGVFFPQLFFWIASEDVNSYLNVW